MYMSDVGLIVAQESWLFVGWTPEGVEVWAGTPAVWLNPPTASSLYGVPLQHLREVALGGTVTTKLPASQMGGLLSWSVGDRPGLPAWFLPFLSQLGWLREAVH
jgi:hypothetical protein